MYSKEKQSFGLIRTNAALTGNVKLTVGSDYSLSLNSIDGHPSLADIKFKAFATDEFSSYHQDLKRLFGNLSSSVIFNVDAANRTTTTQDYSKQYDFRYAAGAKRSVTSYYKEQFGFFAPLHVGSVLPDTFVIYRLDGPSEENEILTHDEKISGVTVPYTKNLQSMLKNAKLVTSFDLSTSSALGRYIRKTTDKAEYVPQSFVFRKDESTDRYFLDWSGISVANSVLTTLSEDVTAKFKNHASIIEFEQYVTEGRSRMGLADHKLINFEFMFDDVDATPYTINRYVGFYADATSTGTVSLDGTLAYNFRDSDGNVPRLKRDQGGAYSADGDFYQQNTNGVKLYIKNQSGVMPVSDTTWIKGKDNRFHGIKAGDVNQLVLDNNKINLGDLRGTSSKQLSLPATRAAASSKSFFKIDITQKPGDFDRIFVEHPTGSVTGKEGSGAPTLYDCDYYLDLDTSTMWVNISSNWTNYGHFNGRLPKTGFDVQCNNFSEINPLTWLPGTSYFTYFNNAGTFTDIAKSIASAINFIGTDFLTAVAIDTSVLVYIKATGDYNSRRVFSTFQCGNQQNTIFNFTGGTKGGIRYSTTETLANQANGLSYVSRKGVDLIAGTVLDLDNALMTGTFTQYIISLVSEPVSATKLKLTLYETIKPQVGDFTFLEWREIDGDFLDSSYATNELDLLRSYFDMQDSIPALTDGRSYSVGGSGSINQGNKQYTAGSVFVAVGDTFHVASGFPIVHETDLIDSELSTTRGISSLVLSPSMQEIVDGSTAGSNNSRISIVNPAQRLEVFNARDRFTKYIASNEYDSLKENMTTTHSLESRTLPWISKWVHMYGTDTRNNPYRFNMSTAFGKGNLSPSFFTKTVSPEELSHEWFYIEGLGRNNKENAWHIDDIFNLADYLNPAKDEFTRYFKDRFVTFEDTLTGCSCIFKGVEYNMPSRARGYKFSIILKRSDPTPGLPPLSFTLYENATYKNMVLLLEVSMVDYRLTNEVIDHILMYSVKSLKTDKNNVHDSYLSSALDFSNACVYRKNLVVPIINRYKSDLRNEIADFTAVTMLSADYPYGYYTITASPTGVIDGAILFPANTLFKATIYDSTGPLQVIPLPFMTEGFWEHNTVKVTGGGKDLFHKTMERLSFGYFNQDLMQNPGSLNSFLVTKLGSNTNTMDLKTSMPLIVSKQNNPFYAEDHAKPSKLINVGKIGYTIENRDEIVNLSRYAGPYVSKTRDCIRFDATGKIDNTSGIIKNMHGVKVGATNILTDLDAPNAYRLINEFPIFNTDLNVFSSSWAKDFYTSFKNQSATVSADGAQILTETGNMFGNILMNLPNQIYIQTFTVDEFSSAETTTVIDIQACITQQILDQAPAIFKTIAGPGAKDLITQYVQQNVLNLYRVLNFDVFVKPKKDLPYEFVSLADYDKSKQGFTKSTAVAVEQVSGYLYSIDVMNNLNGAHSYTASILLQLI